MNASGATSITPALISFGISSGSIMSCSASYSGRRYGSIFSLQRAGQEAEALTGLHGWAGEDDPVDLLGL